MGVYKDFGADTTIIEMRLYKNNATNRLSKFYEKTNMVMNGVVLFRKKGDTCAMIDTLVGMGPNKAKLERTAQKQM
jgi:hypothetical protein